VPPRYEIQFVTADGSASTEVAVGSPGELGQLLAQALQLGWIRLCVREDDGARRILSDLERSAMLAALEQAQLVTSVIDDRAGFLIGWFLDDFDEEDVAGEDADLA